MRKKAVNIVHLREQMELRKAIEAEEKRLKEEAIRQQQEEERLETERKALEEQKRQEKNARKAEARKKAKQEGTLLTKSEKERKAKDTLYKEQLKNGTIESTIKKEEQPSKEESPSNMRSPICCVLGHVDTGKTSLLDKIRSTNVQGDEAGGITQQIGATYFPIDCIRKMGVKCDSSLPGLLIMDTPGHASFTNLRSRGSGLCDMAILVVDLMHGLELQTLESISLLRMRKTPFIIALNKVDRCYGWKTMECSDSTDSTERYAFQNQNDSTERIAFQNTLKHQDRVVIEEFETKTSLVISQLAEKGINAKLFWENDDPKRTVSMVPTSAKTGDGIPDLLQLLLELTQARMAEQLVYSDKVECAVLEVKTLEGLGTTIDVILVNGVLREKDTIVLCGTNGPIVTTIRALLIPQPMRELRIKGEYLHCKEIRASMGVKIYASDLETAVAGSQLLVASKDAENIEELKMRVTQEFASIMCEKVSDGVFVQASTLGSLEALLLFLKEGEIPVSGINIGPVHKRDVVKATIMLDRNPKFAVILAFDVPVTDDAKVLAEQTGVKIITADIIYHLFDRVQQHFLDLEEREKMMHRDKVVWPCKATILHVFNSKSPLILGIKVLEGRLKVGTPLIAYTKEKELGKVISIQKNGNSIDSADVNDEVAVRFEDSSVQFGRHVAINDLLCSVLTRQSIDIMKKYFRNDLSKEEWSLVVRLKGCLKIV